MPLAQLGLLLCRMFAARVLGFLSVWVWGFGKLRARICHQHASEVPLHGIKRLMSVSRR
jgi:hypothetical protein